MNKLLSLSTKAFEEKQLRETGYVDAELTQRRANARMKLKQEMAKGKDFNPFTEDPNCKSCGKKKAKK